MSTLFAPSSKPITFTVYGTPKPQGSTRAYIPKGWTRPIITTDNENLKPWRQEISATALQFADRKFDKATPLRVVLYFFFRRPSSAKKRRGMVVKPDLDKLQRSIFDSLTGILIHDDSQIVSVSAVKSYGDPERVEILITEHAQ